MNAHHIDPAALRAYRKLRKLGRKPADAWRRACSYARTRQLIRQQMRQRDADIRWFVDKVSS